MKRSYFGLILLLFSSTATFSQNGFPWVDPDTLLNFIACPFDSTDSIWMYEGFKVYHTQNDQPDGPVDSSYCIGFGQSQSGFHSYIDGNSINHQKPLFISWGESPELSGLQMHEHSVFDLKLSIYSSTANLFDTVNCSNSNCVRYSAFFEKEITQDSSVHMRYNDASTWYGSGQSGSWYEGSTRCHPTEKHPNHFDSLFVKIDVGSNDSFRVAFTLEFGQHQIIDTSELEQFATEPFTYHFPEWWDPNYLFIHPDSSIPSAQNVHYYDFLPTTNTDSADTITITTGSFVSLVFESFVQFRGGLPLQDSNRHVLNVVYDSAEYCMYGIVERVFGAQTNLIHKSGPLTVRDRACVMFMNDSELRLTENSVMHYGLDGSGMLALRPLSQIKMRKGSRMIFQSKLVLLDESNTLQDEYVIRLPEGSQFEFANGSSITNQFCANPSAKVVFVLAGGHVDLGGLDETSRQLVEIRYEQPSRLQNSSLEINNPAYDFIEFEIESATDQHAFLSLFDIHGKTILNRSIRLSKGQNVIMEDVSSIPPSLYMVSVHNGYSSALGKVVKQ